MPAIFSATERACLGSQASSPTSSLSFLPSTPPAALMSATACSAPFLSWRPNVASPPVIGPATPTLMSWAKAGAAIANPRTKPANKDFFISSPLLQHRPPVIPAERELEHHSVGLLAGSHPVLWRQNGA